MKINLKNLPIFTSLYKLSNILEEGFKAAGRKNAEGLTKALNKLLKLGISGFLKTGKFGVKAVSDVLKVVGLGFVNQSGIDYAFERAILRVTGKKEAILKRR